MLHTGGSAVFGLRDEWPKVPGLRRVYGSAAHVCPDCDGYDTRGKKVVVLASGRKAAGMALNLTTWTRDIVICTNGRDPDLDADQCAKLDALNIPVLSARIDRLSSEERSLLQVASVIGETVPLTILQAVAEVPDDVLQRAAASGSDDDGQIIVDEHQRTSVEHVWAAGDITPGPQLAIVASAEGTVAALSMHKSLVPNDRKLGPPAAVSSAA
jgi:thioredoxin reductase